MAVGFLIPVFTDAGERGELALLNGPAVLVYFLVAGLPDHPLPDASPRADTRLAA